MHVRGTTQNSLIGGHVEKDLSERFRKEYTRRGPEPETLIVIGVILTLCGIMAFIVIVWAYHASPNASSNQWTEACTVRSIWTTDDRESGRDKPAVYGYTLTLERDDLPGELEQMHFKGTPPVWQGLHAAISFHQSCVIGCTTRITSVQRLDIPRRQN